MSVLVDKNSRVLIQGITGREGSFHTGQMRAFGTNIVAGVSPGKGGTDADGVPIFDTVADAVAATGADVSGIFVPPLANDNTIVITAADAKSTSFGCTPESEWTYFGDAFFRQSLHPGSDFENSFNHARILIQGWELMDRLQPSNPQGHFGAAVVEKLAPYFATNGGQ